ncbi:hypothetical protein DFJ77DRAFT_446267 [Powellomyces hirtus]|nr:hypothetical protein DFJ77DRAFT_446267 [Powellomyces hirtus]
MWSGTHLYSGASEDDRSASVNDAIRLHHSQHNAAEIISLFDKDDSLRSSLYCIRPTSKVLDSVLKQCLHTGVEQPGPSTLLSIGSASGLLEYLLQHRAGNNLRVLGVDVAKTNIFLQDDSFIWLPFGASTTEARNQLSDVAIVFVSYLRRPSLLLEYMSCCTSAHTIIVLGPRSEDPVLDECVRKWLLDWGRESVIEESGLRPFDQMKVFKIRTPGDPVQD